jgi:hypothetical protein
MLTILFGLLAIFGVTAIALFALCNMKDDNTTNEFAVNHIEGYDVQSVKYVRDTQGNWTTVSVEYKRR